MRWWVAGALAGAVLTTLTSALVVVALADGASATPMPAKKVAMTATERNEWK